MKKNNLKINKGLVSPLKGGFTLIELLVVVAILGILLAVVLAFSTSSRNKAKDSKMVTQIKGAQTQIDLYTGTRNAYTLGVCAVTPDTVFSSTNNGVGGLFKGLDLTDSRCYSNQGGTTWAIAIKTKTKAGAFCVDSLGVARTKDNLGVNYSNPADAITNTSCN